MKKVTTTFCLALSIFGIGQVGVNTSTPQAMLDIVTSTETEKVLKLSTVTNNVTRSLSDINYSKGAPLYIDDNGYVYKLFTPNSLNGAISVADGTKEITSTWSTVYTLPFNGSILDFSFYTNFSLGVNSRALLAGKVSVGTGTGINIYGHNSSVSPLSGISNNLTRHVSIDFTMGVGLEFRLNENDLQVKLSDDITTRSFITIYNSSITRTE